MTRHTKWNIPAPTTQQLNQLVVVARAKHEAISAKNKERAHERAYWRGVHAGLLGALNLSRKEGS